MGKKLTDSGIEIKEVYTSADAKVFENELPGEFPFTRGVQADMYMANYGPCGSTLVSAQRKKVINGIIIYYHRE